MVLARDSSVDRDNGTSYQASPSGSDLAGQVDGDSGDNVGYVDDDSDIVDGADGDNDVILGEGGDDTITAGAGNDTIYGDHVDELPDGTTKYVVQGFIRDLNFELLDSTLATSGFTEVDITGNPVEIRVIDNDSGAGDDDSNNEIPTDSDQLIEINGVLYGFAPDYQVEFLGSDGNTYTMMVVDVDRDDSGRIDNYDARNDDADRDYEQGQILLPVGPTPPPGIDRPE